MLAELDYAPPRTAGAGMLSAEEAGAAVIRALWDQTPIGSRWHVLHVAVVHGPKSVIRVMAARSCEALTAQLADYVRQNADVQLWPEDARRVQQLLAFGQNDAVVQLYFASVGERWDREWLVMQSIEVDP